MRASVSLLVYRPVKRLIVRLECRRPAYSGDLDACSDDIRTGIPEYLNSLTVEAERLSLVVSRCALGQPF